MVYFSTAAKANTQPRIKSLRRMDIFQLAHFSETSFSVFRSLQGRKEFHHMQWYVVILTAVLATGAIREAAWTNILTFCFFYCCLVLEGNCNWRENQLILVFFCWHSKFAMGNWKTVCRRHFNRIEWIRFSSEKLCVLRNEYIRNTKKEMKSEFFM